MGQIARNPFFIRMTICGGLLLVDFRQHGESRIY